MRLKVTLKQHDLAMLLEHQVLATLKNWEWPEDYTVTSSNLTAFPEGLLTLQSMQTITMATTQALETCHVE